LIDKQVLLVWDVNVSGREIIGSFKVILTVYYSKF